MADLKLLEDLLADALQCMDDAAGAVREIQQLETEPNLKRLGYAINYVWELREEVHKIRPDLKPPFVVEHEQNKLRYNELSKIADQAYSLETLGQHEQAIEKYTKLLSSAVSGYYCMFAEAGLYRLSK